MGRSLIIDVEAEAVRLGSVQRRGQWVDFYAALACTPTPRTYVSAEAIARVGLWRHKAPASVGKEIARHLAWLKQKRLQRLVMSHGRTKAWQLGIAPELVQFRPSKDAVTAWLNSRSGGDATWDAWADGLPRLVESTLALLDGDAEGALKQLDSPSLSGDPALEAWAALLHGRAAYQHDDSALLDRLHQHWFNRTGALGRTVAARLRALMGLKRRFDNPAKELASLGRLAADLELRDDVSALGSVLNVMGLLARRTDDPRSGLAHHLRAAALLGIAGDYPSLEGAIFNLAKSRRTLLENEGRPPDEANLQFVELSRRLCKRLGLSDSAQSEIEGARCAFEMGNLPLARSYLKEAEVIVKRIEPTFDQACFLLLRAELEHHQPTGTSDPIRDLRAAERLFKKAGDKRSAADARRLREQFERERT
jgi:hypothetical protein